MTSLTLHSVEELEKIIGGKLPLSHSSLPYLRHLPVGRGLVDAFLEEQEHTSRVHENAAAPLPSTQQNTAAAASASATAIPRSDSNSSSGLIVPSVPLLSDTPTFSAPSCNGYMILTGEREWFHSFALEESEYNRKLAPFQNFIGTRTTPAKAPHDDIVSWRLMNAAFAWKDPNFQSAALSAAVPHVQAFNTGVPAYVGTPVIGVGGMHFDPSYLIAPSNGPPSFSPGSHHLASVLLGLDGTTRQVTKKPTVVVNAIAKGPLTSLLSPMSQLTNIARTASDQAEKKRAASTAGLAEANGKKQKLVGEQKESLSPPKPLRYTTAAKL